ncbi:GNAT family N-acetyltransferase [Embleya sp. MST-111070]|uniref:GNAT family N-acetyltransferase n=1 Tax=Embleya sp. MST-111070 TaxID=3398231 RepID=UPI003F73588B
MRGEPDPASVARVTLDIREIPKSQVDRIVDLADLAFHEADSADERKQHRDRLRACGRIGAYEDDALVGAVVAHRFKLTVPGGELPCAGLDYVAVAPTHRRRGLLTRMIAEQWRRCAELGQPLSCLWASEDTIYGRFGYGDGTLGCSIEIDARRPLDLRITPDPRPLRLVDPAKAPGLLGPVYAAVRGRRGGRLDRDEEWWRTMVLLDDEDEEPIRVVALGERGETPAGYVVYRVEEVKGPAGSANVLQVFELEARDAPVAAALWAFLVSIDLIDKVVAWARPLDDPLLQFAGDRDQVRVTRQYPALRLRLVDVRTALTARSWAAPVDLVLDVRDAALPANQGRFRFTADPTGATYTAADAAPDLALDVRELATCYLGGTPIRRLVAAGLVTETTPGAAHRLDAALRTDLLPYAHEDY